LSIGNEGREKRGVLSNYLRFKLMPITFTIFIVAFMAGLYSPLGRDDAVVLAQGLDKYMNDIRNIPTFSGKTYYIFMHNAQICILMFFPIAGFFISLYSAYFSGLTLNSMHLVKNIGRLVLLRHMFSAPSTWLEILSYSMVTAESLFTGIGMILRKKTDFLYSFLFLILSESILLLSATIEVYYIIHVR